MLNPLSKITGGFAPRNRRRGETLRPLIVLLSVAWVIAAAGCHSRDAAPSATGQAAAQKPTAEQDAAKQRGEQQGAAIQAANQAAAGAAPGGQ